MSLGIALLLPALAWRCGATPRLTIARTSTPPVVDGLLEDSCWRNAAATTPFVLATGSGLPREQTVARLCWDKRFLYIGIEASEAMLRAALNQMHRVKAEKTGRDAAVFSEDCVEVFLQPGPDTPYVHFAANSGRGTYESKGRDATWNCTWSCRTHRGEGRYTVEMAIPFAALHASPTGTWKFNVTRNRPQGKELSTWCGLQGGFHQPDAFGDLCFETSCPALVRSAWSLQPDGAGLQATLAGAAPTDVLELILSGGGAEQRARTSGGGTKSLRVACPKEALAAGEATVRLQVHRNGKLLDESAPVAIPTLGSRAQLTVRSRDARGDVFLNGVRQPPADPMILRLKPGLNRIALEGRAQGEHPSLSPSLTMNGRVLPLRWRVADATGKTWRNAIPAGTDWQPPVSVRRTGKDGDKARPGLWGSAASRNITLAGALYVSDPGPQLFPGMRTFYLPADSRQLLRFILHNPGDIPTEGYRMILELPRELTVEALEPGTAGGSPQLEPAGSVTVHGVPMTRYAVSYPEFPGQGMELSMRWADKGGRTLTYEPVLRSGGTHDWRHMSAVVTPPPQALSVHPLIIKWQNRGITGTFWVDNVVFREQDKTENLLHMGTFDEAAWKRSFPAEGPDGSKCCKIVSTPDRANRQQACWVDETDVVPVDPGKSYIIELDVRCEKLVSKATRPMLGALVRAPQGMPVQNMPMLTYFEALDGALLGVPRQSTISILPPLRNVRPKTARITPCYYGSRFRNPLVEKAYAENCWKAGITWIYGKLGNGVVPHLLPRGLRVFLSISWDPWSPPAGTRDLLDSHPEWQARDFKGKALPHTVCPTLMLSPAGAPFRTALRDWLLDQVNGEAYAGANWDLEQPVTDPPTFCTCPRCLAAFRQEAGLDPAVKLTPDILLKTYADRWADFRCRQNAAMAGQLKSILAKADHPVEFSMYSGYQNKRTKEHYGVDWAILAPHLDFAIAGYNGGEEQISATLDALGNVPFMGGEMWYLSDTSDARPPPRMETWRNRILRQFMFSGCQGCLIWYLPTMDGGAFYATSEATEIIAKYEDFMHRDHACKERVRVTGIPSGDWSAFANKGNILVLLLNFAKESRPVTVQLGHRSESSRLAPYGVETLVLRDGSANGSPARQ